LADVYFNWSEVMIRSLNRMRPMLESLMGEGGRSFMTLTSLDFPTNTLDDYAAMLETRFTLAREWRAFLSTYPVIVGPTWTQKPFELGFDIRGIDEAFYVVELMRFVLPANLLGLPGACVPTIERDGFAMGAQIIADVFREDIALSAAEDIERACGVLTPIDPRG
jgi:amidase